MIYKKAVNKVLNLHKHKIINQTDNFILFLMRNNKIKFTKH
jgi:hypothetical protein